MKVLLSGYYGFYNIGDEAILKSIIEALRNEDPNIDIVVLSNDVEYTKNISPAEPGIFHMRAKPFITIGTCHVTLVRSGSRE